MSIIIEDGTGKSDAQAYCDYDFYIAFVTEQGMTSNYTREQIEPALVTASKRWIDWTHTFKAEKLVETQALEFPRTDDIGLPLDIKNATAYGAWLHLQGALLVDTASISTSGVAESESKAVGSLSKSVTYKSGSAQIYGRILPKSLTNLLKPYLLASGLGNVYRV